MVPGKQTADHGLFALMARRTRSPHPGIVIESPEGEHTTYRARYVDPDTGRKVRERLDPAVLGSKEARRQWAVRKARALAKRRLELEGGAARASGLPLAEAVDRYFKAHTRLSANTLTAYHAAARRFTAWAERSGLRSADVLNRAALLRFRETLASAPKRQAVKGGRRGARNEAGEARSPAALNRDLRSMRTILGYLVDADAFARLSHDDLRRALKREAAPIDRIEFLKAAELRALLSAALAHDAQQFTETRAEHAGEQPRGSTARYEPIAPFVATCLLTGMRVGAALKLEWSEVDLDAGEIVPRGSNATKRTGVIGLEVSPTLRALLTTMRPPGNAARGRVFGGHTPGTLKAAAKRLIADYSAPPGFTWQGLRRTCGSYLTNAPGIFGAASAYRSARQLGHSVTVAERHYVGLVRNIPLEARTLDAAMGIEPELTRVLKGCEVARELAARNQHAR